MIYTFDIKKKPEGGFNEFLIVISREDNLFPTEPIPITPSGKWTDLYAILLDECWAFLRGCIESDNPDMESYPMITVEELNFSKKDSTMKAVFKVI